MITIKQDVTHIIQTHVPPFKTYRTNIRIEDGKTYLIIDIGDLVELDTIPIGEGEVV